MHIGFRGESGQDRTERWRDGDTERRRDKETERRRGRETERRRDKETLCVYIAFISHHDCLEDEAMAVFIPVVKKPLQIPEGTAPGATVVGPTDAVLCSVDETADFSKVPLVHERVQLCFDSIVPGSETEE